MLERAVLLPGFGIDPDGVPMAEGTPAGVLTADPDRNSGGGKRGVGEILRHAEVNRTLAAAHLAALLEELCHLGMDVEVVGDSRQLVG